MILQGPDTRKSFDGKTIQARFVDEAKKHLHEIAITTAYHVFEKHTFHDISKRDRKITPFGISFSDLMSCVFSIAGRLQVECSIKRHDRVGILIPGGGASPEYLVAMLAILCCGAAYVPVDLSPCPSHNENIQKMILSESKCKALIRTDPLDYLSQPWDFADKLPHVRLESLHALLETITTRSLEESLNQFEYERGSIEDDACLLFTSGSTGKPKAVRLSHKGIRCRIDWSSRITPMVSGEDAILFQLSTTTLGGTMLPLTGLLQGSNVFVAPPQLVADTEALAEALAKHGVNFIISMPSLLKGLLSSSHTQALAQTKTIYLTGEAYSDELLKEVSLASPNANLVNLYGMTETTGHTIAHVYSRRGAVDNMRVIMGLPTDNTNAIIVDNSKTLNTVVLDVKQGCIGELCVSGMGMSKGYLDKSIGAERYFEHNNETFFRTGDVVELCSIHDEEVLRYVGRADRCMKVAGFRVELDGVENILNSLPGVTNAAVIAKEKSFGSAKNTEFITQLFAFVSPGTLSGVSIRSRSLTLLPKHAIPVKIFALDQFPMTVTGKIDRKVLASKLDRLVQSDSIVKNVKAYEPEAYNSVFADVKAAILAHLGPCDPDRSIFHLGATSISVVNIVHMLQPYPISAADIYKLETPKNIAEYISTAGKNEKTWVTNSSAAGQVLLCHASKLLLGWGFFLFCDNIIIRYLIKAILGLFVPYCRKNNPISILHFSLFFHSEVDLSKLEAALKHSMSSFPLLQARYQGHFFMDNLDILSAEEAVLPFEVVSVHEWGTKREAAFQRISYGRGSLVEFLFERESRKLSIICDHVICDYTSFVILAKDITARYNSCEAKISERRAFSDFSRWQKKLNQNWTNEDKGKHSGNRLQLHKEPIYGIPKRTFLSLSPFSIRSNEFFHGIPFSSFPTGISPKVAFLSLWHSVVIQYGGPTEITISEFHDLRSSTFLVGFEHTFGCFSNRVEHRLQFLPSLSLRQNMKNLANSLKKQDEEKPLWSKAHGPPAISLCEGWIFNFIDTRNTQQDMVGASFKVFPDISRLHTRVIQREPSLSMQVFFDGKSVSFQIGYCLMNVSRQTIRNVGDSLSEKIYANFHSHLQ